MSWWAPLAVAAAAFTGSVAGYITAALLMARRAVRDLRRGLAELEQSLTLTPPDPLPPPIRPAGAADPRPTAPGPLPRPRDRGTS